MVRVRVTTEEFFFFHFVWRKESFIVCSGNKKSLSRIWPRSKITHLHNYVNVCTQVNRRPSSPK